MQALPTILQHVTPPVQSSYANDASVYTLHNYKKVATFETLGEELA